MSHPPLINLSLALGLLGPLMSQGTAPPASHSSPIIPGYAAEAARAEAAHAERAEELTRGSGSAEDGYASPRVEQVLEPISTRSEDYFDAVASLRPRRLAPGQIGELHVVVTLRGDAVVLRGSDIELQLDDSELPLALGKPVLAEAPAADVSKQFLGPTLYEDHLEYRVPVTVLGSAAHQKYPVSGRLEVNVVNGRSGESMGRIEGPVLGSISVGPPLPETATFAKSSTRKEVTTASPIPNAPDETEERTEVTPETPVAAGSPERVISLPEQADEVPTLGGWQSMMSLLTVGVLVILLGLLIRRRVG